MVVVKSNTFSIYGNSYIEDDYVNETIDEFNINEDDIINVQLCKNESGLYFFLIYVRENN